MMKNIWMLMFMMASVIIPGVQSYTKRWLHTNLWNDPLNWKPQHLPCLHGKVQMQDGTVFISNETALPSQIVLASDGKIVFARNSVINLGPPLSNVKPEKCEDSVFVKREHAWENPQNWLVVDENRPVPKTLTNAVPYVERVPCKNDDVKFPEHNVFSVNINGEVFVNSVTLKGKMLTSNSELQVYLTTEDGRENFKFQNDNARFGIQSKVCPKEGCICRNYYNREKICGSFTCPPLSCERKVIARDDCCSHCGAIIEFDFDKGFMLESCSKAVKNETDRVGVEAYVSRINETAIEILFTDGGDGTKAEEWMKKVGTDIRKPGHTCVAKRVVELTHNDFLKNKDDNIGPTTTKVTLAIIIPLILIIILIVCLAVYFHRRKQRKFKPERFDDKDVSEYPGFNEVVTTDFMSSEYQPNPIATNKESSQAFSNPSFVMGDLDFEEDPDFMNTALEVGFKNPLYELQQKERKEKELEKAVVHEEPSKSASKPTKEELKNTKEEKVKEPKKKKLEDPPKKDKSFSNPLYDDVYYEFEKDDEKEKEASGEEEEPSPFKEYDNSVVVDLGRYKTLYDEDEFK